MKNKRQNINLKSIKLIISKEGLEQIKSFADESYLYRYIVNNYTELSSTNIFYNPDLYENLSKESLLFVKFDLNEDDEIVIKDVMQELKRKNATYYAYILDEDTKAFYLYKNFSGKLNLPIINNLFENIDDFKVIENIEEYVKQMEIEDEMEV